MNKFAELENIYLRNQIIVIFNKILIQYYDMSYDLEY